MTQKKPARFDVLHCSPHIYMNGRGHAVSRYIILYAAASGTVLDEEGLQNIFHRETFVFRDMLKQNF